MFDNMKIGKLAQTGDPGGLPYYLIQITTLLGAWLFVLFVQNFIVLKLIYTKMFNFIYLFVLNGIFFVIVL